MTNRTWAVIAVVLIAPQLYGCNRATPSPTAPTTTAGSPPLPAGGLPMMGTVSDTAFRPLGGAKVEVLDGPQTGLTTTANELGEFSLTGIFDDATRFRATKEGHITATQLLGPFCARCNPNRWVHFSLELLTSSISISGDYTLEFVADDACTMLPSEVRSRTFTTMIPPAPNATPATPYFTVLVGATFFEDWNTVALGIAGDYVAFWLETVVEQIAPNTFLAFGGQAAASVGTSHMSAISLPFAGSIEYCVTESEQGRFRECYQGHPATRARCESNNHRLILTRRAAALAK
jgi:hypothetical protein